MIGLWVNRLARKILGGETARGLNYSRCWCGGPLQIGSPRIVTIDNCKLEGVCGVGDEKQQR